MEIVSDLKNRIEEVEIYFAFVNEVDNIETHKRSKFIIGDSLELNIKRDIQKILRANCYLLLYNLTEATIRNGIWSMHDAVDDEKVSFENLSLEIQNIWLSEKANELSEISNLNNLKSYLKSHITENESNIIVLSKKRISVSGNLDFRSIEKLTKDYGFFGINRSTEKIKLGKALLKIKAERNALAHGNKSFRNSAEIITMQELNEYKKHIILYLEDVTNNIESYIKNKKFLKK